uniref:Matrix metallopeptidase 28 n=1 Tax=Latimeria chalumnae TaxID=7897 RepID=H3BGG9_LATCH
QVFLERYGYLKHRASGGAVSGQLQEAVSEFQWLSHLPISGVLDNVTVQKMALPRCGVKDADSHAVWTERVNNLFSGQTSKPRRKKRYSQQGDKWYKHRLTYRIVNWPRYLSQSQVRLAVKTAFELWSNVSSLVFWEVAEGLADIRLAFFQGEHNDGINNAFDGPGGALAHAFFPRRGEAHFDNDERWSLDRGKGRNLFIVTAHEIGHTLGLEHSPVKNALMSPYYKKLGKGFVLSWDDILAIQNLYGKPSSGSAVQLPGKLFISFQNLAEDRNLSIPTTAELNLLGSSYCSSLFDAIMMDLNQIVYIFKGIHYWTVLKDANVTGPHLIQKSWARLPATIEAAAVSPANGKTYFFRGGRCWRYRGTELEEGFPRKVNTMGVPRHPDSAFYFQPLGHMVILKGNKYYVVNEESLQVEAYYPRSLDDWKGVPVHVNGVIPRADGFLYFFKDDRFLKFDKDKLRVVGSGFWMEELKWTGCQNRNATVSII